ncbi:MAG: hypothetical protein IPO79_06340 [Flavobacteriales bacterium]|nr:hypothetical protein [Flavobacteriales bacterium]MBK9699705.1 hypothetical protein [Flavobacteriales bacterium]
MPIDRFFVTVSVGLLFEESGRYRMLPTIRAYVHSTLTLGDADLEALNRHFLDDLAAKEGDKVGAEGGAAAAARLKAEAANIEHLLKLACKP